MTGPAKKPIAAMDRRRRQRGTILIAVSFVGMFAMLLSGGLISHFAVSEARAVANSLAKVRVYWAMVGHMDYALSRMRQQNPTAPPFTSDVDLAGIQGILLTYFDELDFGSDCRGSSVPSATNSKCSKWVYDEVSSEYVFHFKWTIFDPAGGTAADGALGVRLDYVIEGATNTTVGAPTSSIESINNLSERLRDLEYEVCFVAPVGPPIGGCVGSGTTPLLSDASGAVRVTQVRRCRFAQNTGSAGTLAGSPLVDNTGDDTCT